MNHESFAPQMFCCIQYQPAAKVSGNIDLYVDIYVYVMH